MGRKLHGVTVEGRQVDEETRCKHYAGPDDVVAIRFPCCDTYYPCHRCHAEVADHVAAPWAREAWDEEAVLCGVCGERIAIADHLEAPGACPACGTGFNPGCREHHHLYFGPAARA